MQLLRHNGLNLHHPYFRRRRDAMENDFDFESFEIVEKRSVNETYTGGKLSQLFSLI